MIEGYAKHGLGVEALEFFRQMQHEGIQLSNASYLAFLKACCYVVSPWQGMHAHMGIIEDGFESDMSVHNTLLAMYAKYGELQSAGKLFDRSHCRDVVTWNVMMSAYAHRGHVRESLACFHLMHQEGVQPNVVTWNSLMAGFLQCGYCQEALNLHHRMHNEAVEPDTVTWNVLMSGLVQHGHGEGIFLLFQQMHCTQSEPNEATFIFALKACSILMGRNWGRQLHAYVVETGYERNILIVSTLINMYAACDCLRDAYIINQSFPSRNVGTWSALIGGCIENRNYELAFQCFKEMLLEGVKPNEVTFLSILSACSHAGLVDEGYHYFMLMQELYGISPTLGHYNCMVDILGGAGYLLQAELLLFSIPSQANVVGWTNLLSHCRKHREVDLGMRCYDRAVALGSMDLSML